MSYRIKELSYKNLKHVGLEAEQLSIGRDMTLLDGPNGYGKSTVFDAIELLLTGNIERNKGKMASVANNSKENIVVKAYLEENGNQIELERTIWATERFMRDSVTWNQVIIDQNELYRKLNLSESAMGIAIYVSQLKSLSYLEKKETDRKKVVTNLVDDSKFKEKLQSLENFKKVLGDKLGKEEENLAAEIENAESIIQELTGQIANINKLKQRKGYTRLFKAKDYEFDKEQLNKTLGYSEMVKPLEDIKEFLGNYEIYNKTKKYHKVEKVLKLSSNQFKAFFYNKVIQATKENLKLYKDIEELEVLLKDKQIQDVKQINQLLEINEEDRKEIETVIGQYNDLKNTEQKNETYIIELIEKRDQLFDSYEASIGKGLWNKAICPFCGQDADDLSKLFDDTEKVIRKNNSLLVERIQQLKELIDQYFEERQKELEQMIRANNDGYKKYLEVKELLQLHINADEKQILKEKKFENVTSDMSIDFEGELIRLKKELEAEKGQIGEILEPEVLAKYENVVREYYSEQEFHTIEQIEDKVSYIAECYGDDYQKRLDVCNESLKKMKTELEQKHKSNEHMMLYTETYIDKYKKALNTYQTNLVQQIKVPLYVYSGKVIQNYPMGLGVIANIKSSTIVFETEKKEEDVFHYLSAGQLNGVMLSVMLAVRSIVDLRQSLNIIMIDDPLQTIDDVSAFSYADLLAEQFDDAQIVLSTHEADKSNLLEFKFRQHERTVEKYNMHDRYLGIK